MNHSLKASVTVAVLLVCGSAVAQQADRTQTERLAQRAADRLQSLHEEADRLASEERTLLGDLRRLEIERQIASEEFRQIEADTTQVAADLSALDTQIAELEEQNQSDSPRLQARLVDLYKLGQGRYLRLLLSTSEVWRIGQASRMVAAIADQDQNRVTRYRRRLEDITRSRTTLDARRLRLVSLQAEASRATSAADRAVVAQNALIREIDQRRDLNAQFAGELIAAQQQLQATLTGLADSAATASSLLPIAPFRGDLAWPVAGSVRQAFGRAALGGGVASNGIDIAAEEGDAARAVHDGTVAFAGPFSGFGHLVIVDHGGRAFSLYGNLRDTLVIQGRHVARGDPLGTVGVAATGAAGLYFELRIDARPVDPLQWLRKR